MLYRYSYIDYRMYKIHSPPLASLILEAAARWGPLAAALAASAGRAGAPGPNPVLAKVDAAGLAPNDSRPPGTSGLRVPNDSLPGTSGLRVPNDSLPGGGASGARRSTGTGAGAPADSRLWPVPPAAAGRAGPGATAAGRAPAAKRPVAAGPACGRLPAAGASTLPSLFAVAASLLRLCHYFCTPHRERYTFALPLSAALLPDSTR